MAEIDSAVARELGEIKAILVSHGERLDKLERSQSANTSRLDRDAGSKSALMWLLGAAASAGAIVSYIINWARSMAP